MKYKHIFFDLDRTLWDFEYNSHETLLELCKSYNLKEKGVENSLEFIKIYKKRKADEATRFTWDDSSRFKLMARLQIGILLIIPFLANMIARGMGVS